PFASDVNAHEQIRRVTPVIRGIHAQCDVAISIDTRLALVARAALDEGVEIINDVSGLEGDPDMLSTALRSEAGICVMHMQGTPQTMQVAPHYNDVVTDVADYLQRRCVALSDVGFDDDRVCLDPGVGFGKTHEHNLELMRNCRQFHDLGRPLLVGHSRKGFLGKLLGDAEASRDAVTAGASVAL
ncbi:MAG: dihydropteroate synthase, partial [Planctomycetaceae bacterium]|nr:dihydropteroate synthase [Planctomycetaceae bacterium]